MNLQQRQPIVERSVSHFQRVLDERERSGDPTAIVHRYSGPWRTDTLGPPIEEGLNLQAVYRRVLSGGRRELFDCNGRPIPWEDDAQTVVSRFFAALRDANDRPWQRFEDGLAAVWHRIEKAKAYLAENPGRHPGKRSLSGGLAACEPWQSMCPSLAHSHRIAVELTLAAMSEAFTSTFANGQILVFEQRGNFWEPRPPHQWQASPPLNTPTLTEIEHRRDADALRSLNDEIDLVEHRARHSVFGSSNKIHLCGLSLRRSVLTQSASLLRAIEQKRAKDAGVLAFIVSSDLAQLVDFNLGSAQQSDVNTSKPGPKPKKHLYDPFVAEGVELRRRGDVSSNSQAATVVMEKYPQIEQIAASPAAAHDQLRKQIGVRLNSSDLPQ